MTKTLNLSGWSLEVGQTTLMNQVEKSILDAFQYYNQGLYFEFKMNLF